MEMLSKKDEFRMNLLMARNVDNVNALTSFMQKLNAFPDGIKVYKERVLGPMVWAEEKDIPLLANLLHIALVNIKEARDMMEITMAIINKFEHPQLQIKLLKHADKSTGYKNVFSVISGASIAGERRLWEYLLSFIDSRIANEVLLKPDHEGKSPLLRLLMRGSKEVYLVLEKIGDTTTTVLNAVNYLGNTLLEQSSMDLLADLMRYLEEEQLAQFIVNQINSGVRVRWMAVRTVNMLFNYVQEQVDIRDNLLHDLLFNVKRKSDGLPFFTYLINCSNCPDYWDWPAHTDWIWPYIMKLEPDQIEELLAQTDDSGNTPLMHCVQNCQTLKVWRDLLALYADDDAKKRAIVQMNYAGKCSFDLSFTTDWRRSKWGYQSYELWHMRTSNGDGFLFSNEERLQLMNTALPEWDTTSNHQGTRMKHFSYWRKWIKQTLDEMDTVQSVELLIPLWRLATFIFDIEFAKQILSKLDGKNTELVTAFLTTSCGYTGSTVLHHAAEVKYDRTEMMQLLISLAYAAKVDIRAILLKSQVRRNRDETPLMVAVDQKNHKITSLILSQLSSKKEKQRLMEMERRDGIRVSNKKWEIQRNTLIIALQSKDVPMVKQLLENCDNIKTMLKYKNAVEETIHHYLITQEMCEYFKTMKVTFNFKSWSIKDVNGVTPFMKALQGTGDRSKIEFIEWIFANCCKNTDEKLKLIYQYDNDGLMALDKVSGTVMHFLIHFVKSKVAYKSSKDLDKLIPLYLYSLRNNNLKMAKWTLSLLKNASDRKKLVNCNDEFGVNTVFAAIQSDSMEILNFVLNQNDFDQMIVFNTDRGGRTSLHYAAKTTNISIFKEVLSIYQRNEKGDFESFMFGTDEEGNNSFTYAVKEGIDDPTVSTWILQQFDDDINLKMKLLFARNKNGEVPLIENYSEVEELDIFMDCIYEFWSDRTVVINEEKIDLAARSLMFLTRSDKTAWTMKIIVDAMKDDDMTMQKILSVRDTANNDILYKISQHRRWKILKWFLEDVVPNDHPCLFSRCKITGKTTFMRLVIDGKIDLAKLLLAKITDNVQKLQLMRTKTLQPGCFDMVCLLCFFFSERYVRKLMTHPTDGWKIGAALCWRGICT